MAQPSDRQTAINLGRPEPSNVATGAVPKLPTQIMEVGNTAIVNFNAAAPSAASKVAQVQAALVLPTADPGVKNAIWLSATNTTSGVCTILVSTQAT